MQNISSNETTVTPHTVSGLISKAIGYLVKNLLFYSLRYVKERKSRKELFLSFCFSFKTYIELNNPVVIFKCDQAYIQERLMIYGGLIDKIEKKRSEAKREPSEREQFMKLMHTDLVEESSATTSKKKPTEKREEETIDDEIVEYTNTLTVWVTINIHLIYLFGFEI